MARTKTKNTSPARRTQNATTKKTLSAARANAQTLSFSTYGHLPLVLLCIVAVLGIIALMLIASSRNHITNDTTPSQTVTPGVARGDIVKVDILINGGKDVAGLQTDIVYDSSVLEFVRIDKGTVLGNGASTIVLNTMNTSSPGVIKNYAIVRLGSGTSGNGTVASAYFTAKQRGKTTIRLSNTLLANSNGEAIPTTAATLTVKVQR